jgi:glycosyltransferase involved in cell wall biosynthesis
MNASTILHVVSPLGGGVDRHVRDVMAAVARPQVLWHVGERAEVVEGATRDRRYLPLDPARIDAAPKALSGWMKSLGIGAVHLHTVVGAPRRRAQWLARELGAPLLVTLHDVLFLRRDAFDFDAPQADRAWTRKIEPVLRQARAVLAPSAYVADLAAKTFSGLAVDVVPNGLEPRDAARAAVTARPEFLESGPQRVVAVVGAIGEHKGAGLLRELPRHLEGSGIGVVVIGYLDRQIYPGWQARPHLYVHGPYHPADTVALLQAYGAELVLFPNRVPESFSYTLSEAWDAGLPALAAPAGAIGERIARHGGGWLLPRGFGAAQVAAELCRLLAPESAAELARVKSGLCLPDAARVPTLAAMAESLDAYYRRYALTDAPPSTADVQAVDALLAPSLDSSLFRVELAHLANLCDQSGSDSKRVRDWETEARRWIAKLEGDVSTLQQQLRAEFEERQRVTGELAAAGAMAAIARRMPDFVKKILARLVRARG